MFIEFRIYCIEVVGGVVVFQNIFHCPTQSAVYNALQCLCVVSGPGTE